MFGLGEHAVSSGTGIPAGGINSYEDWNTFAKAVQTSGYDTDHASLTGSQALRLESLEGQLRKVIESEETFKLFKALKRTPVTSAVHEFTVQEDIGGSPSGSFNTELGVIQSDVGNYERRVVFIKYLMTQAAISHVASVQKGIVDLKANENRNALLRLSRSANWAAYHGDSTVAPSQFDGVYAQLKSFRSGSHIRDLQGTSDVSALMDAMYNAYAEVIGVGNFGRLTHAMMDPSAQTALDRDLDPAYRVYLDSNPGSVSFGAPVTAIKTSFGNLQTEQDIWIDNEKTSMPSYARYNRVAEGAPGAPTIASAVAGNTGSQFTAPRDGTYYYVVCAINAAGVESIPSVAASVAVTAGQDVTLTITPNADLKQTGYAIYRSVQDPAAAPALTEYRLVERIAANSTPASNTVYVDANALLPGRSTIYLLNRVPESISWVQLLPATQFPLYPTNTAVIPWAVLLYGAVQVSIPNHHFILDNFIPKQATWKPHG